MAKTNYSKMSKPKTEQVEIKDATNNETKAPIEKKTVIGKVFNCKALNLREQPNKDSKVLKVLDVNAKITINESFKNDAWYCVTVGQITGYCMKEFIQVNS